MAASLVSDLTRRGFLKTAGQGMLAATAAGASLSTQPTTQLAPPNQEAAGVSIPKPPKKKLGYAIVGLGELALGEVLPAFAKAERARPVALVSGHPEKAKKVAEHYGISDKAIYDYQKYEQMADNKEIDVVYLILPNSMHAEYTIRALKIGKHVLCEKPMATSVAECEQMIAAAKAADRKLMIAYRLHYEPYNQTMIELSRKQAYGKVQLFQAANVQVTNPPNIRLTHSLGGGALMDVGIYCLNAARYITGEEPTEVNAMLWSDPNDPRFREVEQSIQFQLRFPGGALAQCNASFDCAVSRSYRVYCEDGWYGLDPAFAYEGLRLHIGKEKSREELILPQVDQFAKEMDHLSECIAENKTPWTPGEEGLADIKLMMKIYEAAHSGKTLKV